MKRISLSLLALASLLATVQAATPTQTTYDVWGGNNLNVNCYDIDKYGYTLLGTTNRSAIFYGQYSNYVVVVKNPNVLYLDTVQASSGKYYTGTVATGNTPQVGTFGAPDKNYTVLDGAAGGNASPYTYGSFAVFTNIAGWTSMKIIVFEPALTPTIISQPVSPVAIAGDTVTLTVTLSGEEPFSYQWLKNGTKLFDGGRIAGATSTNLTLSGLQASDAGSYTVTVTNNYGHATSAATKLTVLSLKQATYDVWGGSSFDAGKLYDNVDQLGFVKLGTTNKTATFYGQYNYYVVAVKKTEMLFLDAVQTSSGSYYHIGFLGSGNIDDTGDNVNGAPDGKYMLLDGPAAGSGSTSTYGSFAIFQNTGGWNSMKFYVYEPTYFPVTVNLVGKGIVTGLTNGQPVLAGSMVAPSATPGTGYVLTNWLVQVDGGTVLSTNKATPFLMQSNLVLTVTFADVQKPVLTITAPALNQRWSNEVFTAAGKVADNGPGGAVWYQLNGGAWNTAAGWSNWTAGVTLMPGTNTVAAYALDTAGNRSATNSQKLVYVLSAPISLNIAGKGTVSGASDGQLLELGKSVTLTAAPGTGYVLTNWLVQVDGGTVLSTNKATPFLMQSNLVLTVTFADVQKPVLTITAPALNQRWSNEVFTAAGKVADNGPGGAVWYQLNGGAWNTAAGWSNWTAGVTLMPGTNTVAAYALDTAGNRSATNSQKLVYVLSAPISLNIAGKGTVSGASDGQLLELGKSVTLTAAPGTGYVLTNWLVQVDGGTVLSTNKATPFLMQSNLVLTVTFADVQKPVLTITAPALNQRWSNEVFTAAGKVADNGPGGAVWYQLNGGAWNTAAGWSNWTAGVTLMPGTNTVAAYALDTAGNRSATNSQKLVYVLSAPISLNIAGKGTVSGASDGQLLELGKSVTLTAAPGTGYVLTNWLVQVDGGTVLSTNKATPFLMQSNLVLTVTFADVQKPVLTITAPALNQRWSNEVFTAAGKVADNGPGGAVWYQLNGGAWNTAAGWSNWTAGVTLMPGTNTVAAYALDTAGNRSATNSQKLVYVLSAPISLNIAGKGTVSGASDGQLLELGKSVTLTAAPGTGYVLTNWLVQVDGGTVLSTNKATPFLMQSNLVLTVTFADVQKPVLTITAPALNQRWSNEVFTAAGKVADNGPGGAVWYQLNGGAWNTAAGWSNWTAGVTLMPGTNTVAAYALDTAGNRSATNSQKLVYVLSAPISLNIAGKGTVSGASDGQLLELGKSVTLTAAPGTGYVLTNWLVQVDGGTVLSTNKATPFLMQSNLVLTVTFADVQKPVLTITAPALNQRWSNEVFTAAGKVADNGPGGAVWYQLNGGAWNTAAGWSNWTAGVTLMPGTNTVAAYALDTAGNRSATNSQKLVYVLSAPISLNIAGKGTVSGASDGQLLELGKSVTLTAAPGTGYVLTNWLVQVDGGTVLSTNKATPFLMQSNLVLTVTFADVQKPVLTITAPALNQRWSNEVFTAAGKVADNGPGGAVWYQLNGGAWNTAAGWSNWTAGVTLMPGTNTVAAYALDTAGNRSATNTVKVNYVVTYVLADYFPMPLGAYWHYTGTDWDGYPADMSWQVADTNYTLDLYTGSPVRSYSTNSIKVDCAYLDPNSQQSYDDWQDFRGIIGRQLIMYGDDDLPDESLRVDGGAKFPVQLSVGEKVTTSGTAYSFGVKQGTMTLTFQLLDQGSLTVPAGTFDDVLHLRLTMSGGGDTRVQDWWWARGVGEIKSDNISGDGSAMGFELDSYSLPAASALAPAPLAPSSLVPASVVNQAVSQPPPVIEPGKGSLDLSARQFGFYISGQAEQVVIVESSPDLVHWTPVQTNTMTADGIFLSVPVDRQPAQFFRALVPKQP